MLLFTTFTDNFNDIVTKYPATHELGKVSWNKWQVFDGSIDFYTSQGDAAFTVAASYAGFTTEPPNKFVDLDGTVMPNGKAGFLYHAVYLPVGDYTLSIRTAGSQRAASTADSVRIYLIPGTVLSRPLPAATWAATVAQKDKWVLVSFGNVYPVTSAGDYILGFQGLPQPPANGDDAGLLLDSVSLSCQIPPDPDHADSDQDGIMDTADNCPAIANHDQTDSDHDGVGDACQIDTTPPPGNHTATPPPPPPAAADSDQDGVPDSADNCKTVANSNQADLTATASATPATRTSMATASSTTPSPTTAPR